ncbi:MAG: chaperonin GroEL (HSP60 family) [Candidatus Woesearchaeota archaeon]|jgi:chaperonin GroEL (HSP60 family)
MGSKESEVVDMQRVLGKTAQKENILAAQIVADLVKTTLGPKGMDKVIVTGINQLIVTNDGATILQELGIEHPIAKMMIEIAKSQESQVGDGTTTAVVLAGEFLRQAQILLDKKVHPTLIVKGYKLASIKALEYLQQAAIPVDKTNVESLVEVAKTAMTGKGAEVAKEALAAIVVKALLSVGDRKNVNIITSAGHNVEQSALFGGIIMDKLPSQQIMPTQQQSAKVLLLSCPIEVRDTETKAQIQITSPQQMQAFLDQEDTMIKKSVEKIIGSGATAVFCLKGVDDLAQQYLAQEGIAVYRRVRLSDLHAVSKLTNAPVVNNILDVHSAHLGTAAIKTQTVSQETHTVIEGKGIVTIYASATTPHVASEIQRALDDALGDVQAVLQTGTVVSGAGAIEVHLTQKINEYAATVVGKEQLAIRAFADSFEVIPIVLAENAGLDPIDTITKLHAAHKAGRQNAGLNIEDGSVDLVTTVKEPTKVKEQAILGATEVSTMILRIDDVILANQPLKEDQGHQLQ